MKPIQDLTHLGRLRRQRRYLQQALAQYPLQARRADLLSCDTNFLYRIQAADGQRYVLRLAYPGWRTRANAESEALWLAALARDTDLPVPRLISSSLGEAVVSVGDEESPNRHAILMTWVPGVLLGRRLTPDNLFKMGQLFARLHQHAAAWQVPPGFAPQKFDRFLSRREPDALLAAEQRAAPPDPAWQTIRRIRDRVDAAYAALDPAGLRPIHCDLWHDNIKVHQGVLAPFDFEDTIWGYPIHDLAMGLLDLAQTVGAARYHQLLPVLRAGYETHLPWPQGDLTLFQLGRLLWSLNWIARFNPANLPQALQHRAELFQRYEHTHQLTDPLDP